MESNRFKSKFRFIYFNQSKFVRTLILLTPMLFWYISLFPAVLTPDSYSVIAFVRSESVSGFHTVAYELFVKVLSVNGRAIYVVSLFQLILNYYALYLTTKFIFNRIFRYPVDCYLITSLLFATPFFGPISMTIWKDNPHNAFIIIGGIKLIEIFVSYKFKSKNSRRIWVYISVIAIGALFRHEAFAVFLVLAALLIMFSLLKVVSQKTLLNASVIALIIAALSLCVNSLAQSALNSKPVPKYQRTLSFLLDLEYVNSKFPKMLDDDSQQILSEISSGSSLQGARDCDSPFNFWGPGFDESKANKYSTQIPSIWLAALKSNARDTVLEARFCRTTSFTLWPFSKMPSSGFWPTTGISPNEIGFENPRITFPLYTLAFAWSYVWGVNGNLIAWPGLHLGLLLLVNIYVLTMKSISRRLKFGLSIVTAFFLSRSIVLFITVASQEFRYQSGLYFLTMPIIAGLVLTCLKPRKNV